MSTPEHPTDSAFDDVARFESLTCEVDGARVDTAAGALNTIRDHDRPPRAVSWAGALVALEAFADALADLEGCQVDYDSVTLLVPHLALAHLAPGVAARERPATVTDIFGRSL
jgi:hypothetical protein